MVLKTRWYLKCFKVCFAIDQHHHDGEDVPYGEGCLYKQPKLYDGKTRWVDGPTWTHVIMSILAFLRSWGWLHLTIRMIILVIMTTLQKDVMMICKCKVFQPSPIWAFQYRLGSFEGSGSMLVCVDIGNILLGYWRLADISLAYWQTRLLYRICSDTSLNNYWHLLTQPE